MSTAIERVEAALSKPYWRFEIDRTDLPELLRLAKLGERVEMCKDTIGLLSLSGSAWEDGANALLDWIREGT